MRRIQSNTCPQHNITTRIHVLQRVEELSLCVYFAIGRVNILTIIVLRSALQTYHSFQLSFALHAVTAFRRAVALFPLGPSSRFRRSSYLIPPLPISLLSRYHLSPPFSIMRSLSRADLSPFSFKFSSTTTRKKRPLHTYGYPIFSINDNRSERVLPPASSSRRHTSPRRKIAERRGTASRIIDSSPFARLAPT